MSWDVYLEEHIPACDHCGRGGHIEQYYDRNYTSNMFPMLKRAGFDWDDVNGKLAGESAPLINAVIEKMALDRQGYEALNPDNGWGDYKSFLAFLCEVASACKAHPKAIVRVSR